MYQNYLPFASVAAIYREMQYIAIFKSLIFAIYRRRHFAKYTCLDVNRDIRITRITVVSFALERLHLPSLSGRMRHQFFLIIFLAVENTHSAGANKLPLQAFYNSIAHSAAMICIELPHAAAMISIALPHAAAMICIALPHTAAMISMHCLYLKMRAVVTLIINITT